MVSKELIEKARELHGHICPFLILGLRMSEIAMSKLGISKASAIDTVEEKVVAIVEVNNCLVDGVQVATGCSFGNNSLIYLDLGKNALTLFKRGNRRGVRVYIDSEKLRAKYFSEKAVKLFEKVVVERKATSEETEELRRIWEEIGYRMADLPEEEFLVQTVEIVEEVERAPIFRSLRCSKCGELVAEPRSIRIGDKVLCLVCAGEAINAVIGRGIMKIEKVPYRIIVDTYTQ
ncbi:MAG: FmdE family protein [Ignisphaera sp.]|uniref:Formylmethanofuran dehydrogenase n=1 Tax=Ignisphaera aggregans TaxID=334771 RepID=A0A7J3N040_9CREN